MKTDREQQLTLMFLQPFAKWTPAIRSVGMTGWPAIPLLILQRRNSNGGAGFCPGAGTAVIFHQMTQLHMCRPLLSPRPLYRTQNSGLFLA